MIDRRELLGFAAAATVASHSAPLRAAAPKRAQKPSRGSEIRALREFAEQTHPRGREARDDAKWQAGWARLERAADALSDGAYLVEARRALAWFEDGHTTVLPFDFVGGVPAAFAPGPFGLNLPWKVKLFDDGAYVVASDDAGRNAVGARVETVGALSTADLMKAWDASWPGNRAWSHAWADRGFASVAQLQALGSGTNLAAGLSVKLSGAGAPALMLLRPARSAIALTSQLPRRKSQRELWADQAKRGNYVRNLPDRRAIYISIDDMDDVEGATFEQLTREAFAAIDSASAKRLIVDLRRNGGGNNFFGEALRKRIERSSFNHPGRLYVLIGPATFSAAQNLAARLERETFATFVGEPTGLAPNHYGDSKVFRGAVTGLPAMVSTLPWFDSYPQDKREWIMPDRLVRSTFEDWQAGRDAALDAALAETFGTAPDDLSRDRIFFYRRASQKQEWTPFWV